MLFVHNYLFKSADEPWRSHLPHISVVICAVKEWGGRMLNVQMMSGNRGEMIIDDQPAQQL